MDLSKKLNKLGPTGALKNLRKKSGDDGGPRANVHQTRGQSNKSVYAPAMNPILVIPLPRKDEAQMLQSKGKATLKNGKETTAGKRKMPPKPQLQRNTTFTETLREEVQKMRKEATAQKMKVPSNSNAVSSALTPQQLQVIRSSERLRNSYKIPKKNFKTSAEESDSISSKNRDDNQDKVKQTYAAVIMGNHTKKRRTQTSNKTQTETASQASSLIRKRKSGDCSPQKDNSNDSSVEDIKKKRKRPARNSSVVPESPIAERSRNSSNNHPFQHAIKSFNPDLSQSLDSPKLIPKARSKNIRKYDAILQNGREILKKSSASPSAPPYQEMPVSSEEMEYNNTLPEIMEMVSQASGIPEQNTFNEEADAMDVDMVPSCKAEEKKGLLVIADTNVWISNRNFIEQILANFQTFSTILIPWMVLQEIDYNIHKNKIQNKKQEFQHAAKYIHSLLSLHNDRVRGQKAAEAMIGMEFNELMADDSILSCVLQYRKLSHFVTVFVTNDINLLNKALVHEVNAFKPDIKLISEFKSKLSTNECRPSDVRIPELYRSFESNETDSEPKSSSISEVSMEHSCPPMNQRRGSILPNSVDAAMDIDTDDPMEEEMSKNTSTPLLISPDTSAPTFETVVTNLRRALTNIIIPKMAEEYGDDGWQYAIKIKPPFTVESGLKCIQLHWIAVFSFMFPPRGKELVDELMNTFNTKPNPNLENEIISWRSNICRMAVIFLSMNSNLVKRERISETINQMKAFLEKYDRQKS